MSDEPNSKRRKMDTKQYYKNQNKPRNFLEPGIRGFLATCNYREKECFRECINLLNEYADQIIETQSAIESEQSQSNETPDNSKNVADSEEEEDISSALENEIKTISEAKKGNCFRFHQVDTKVTNCIFIKTTLQNAHEIGVRLMRDIAEKKEHKTRYLTRLWPVDAVCRANNEDIKSTAGRLIDKVFLNVEPTTYAVVVNKRHNTTFDRMQIIQEIAEIINFKNPAHKVDLKNAKMTVAIEIIKGLCCISLLPDYNKLKKYNIHELTQPKEEKPTEEKPTGEPKTSKDDNGKVEEIKHNETGDKIVETKKTESTEETTANEVGEAAIETADEE